MPTVVARFAGLLLILLLLASLTGSADGPRDEAEFHYLHGFEASGEFEGRCDVAGFRFDTGKPRHLTVDAQEIELTILRTWRNSTVIGEPVPREIHVTAEQSKEVVGLPSGPVQLEWGPDAHLYLSRAYDVETRSMETPLDGTSWHSSDIKNGIEAGPGYYYAEIDGSPVKLPTSIAGPSRIISTEQDSFSIQGGGFFRFDGLTITSEDFVLEMPPYKQYERTLETPVSHMWSILHTNGALSAKGLNVTVPADQGELGCSGLEWAGEGAVTYRAATGNVTQSGETHGFTGGELTLNGTWATQESAERVAVPWGHQSRINTAATGSFAGGVDYEPLAASDPVLADVSAQLTILGVLATISFAMWKWGPAWLALFTRVKREQALEHPVRETIHQSALNRPGTTLIELVRESGQSYSTIQHHARLLVRLDLVSLIRFGREVHVFSPRTPRWRARQVVCLRSESVRYLLDLVGSERLKLREARASLQNGFGKGPSWATRIVGQAERAGLVEREKTENGVMLCAREP